MIALGNYLIVNGRIWEFVMVDISGRSTSCATGAIHAVMSNAVGHALLNTGVMPSDMLSLIQEGRSRRWQRRLVSWPSRPAATNVERLAGDDPTRMLCGVVTLPPNFLPGPRASQSAAASPRWGVR